MSVNCIRCVERPRTHFDLLCDQCRGSLPPMDAYAIYTDSNGETTKALYDRLATLGATGIAALNLFRAQKASSRAKVYRGGGFKRSAYDKKNWSLKQLCDALSALDKPLGEWGWKEDTAQEFHKWVLYVELPTGQASFHSASPLCVRRYIGEWDGQHLSAERIIRFVQQLLDSAICHLPSASTR